MTKSTESLTSKTDRPENMTVEEMDEEIEKEFEFLRRIQLIQYLKRLRFKPGKCDYCGAKTEVGEEDGTLVYVKKLPNGVSACVRCYKRGE